MELDFISVAISLFTFVVGVVVSQRVKDWLQGVPGHVRADLRSLEASALGQIKSAQAHVLADLKSKVVVPTPVLQTSAPALPVAAVAPPASVAPVA